jgi:hypothetical protein
MNGIRQPEFRVDGETVHVHAITTANAAAQPILLTLNALLKFDKTLCAVTAFPKESSLLERVSIRTTDEWRCPVERFAIRGKHNLLSRDDWVLRCDH